MQVAEYLSKVGKDVRWSPKSGGPALPVEINGEYWFVECYCYSKSFGLYLFLEELLWEIDKGFRVRYEHFENFLCPKGRISARFPTRFCFLSSIQAITKGSNSKPHMKGL